MLVDDVLGEALDLGVAELALGLPLELRLADFHREHTGEALADVVAAEVYALVCSQHARAFGVAIQGASERRLEATDVGTAVAGVDVIHKGIKGLLVRTGPLQGELDLDIVALSLDHHRRRVQRRSTLIQVLDEVGQAALGMEDLGRLGAIIDEVNRQVWI